MPGDTVRGTQVLGFALLAVFIVLAVRLFQFTSLHAVNMLFWDQWDFLNPFFTGGSFADRFWQQHGPHRQGLGAVVTSLVYAVTGWNTRAEAFTVSGILVVAAAVAAWTTFRLFNRLHPFDLLIPVLFLTLHQWELVAGAVNPAHGSLPLLLATGMAFAQTVDGFRSRVALTAVLGVLATFTGFGLFLGVLAPVVLGLETWRAANPRHRRAAALASVVATIGLGAFFVGYEIRPALGCHQAAVGSPWDYVRFVGTLLLARTTLIYPQGWTSTALAGGAVALLVAVAFSGWRGALHGDRRSLVVAILTSFALMFGAATAAGRLCPEWEAATASRYVPYATTAWFGAFLWLTSRLDTARWPRDVLLALTLVVLLGERFDRGTPAAAFYPTVKRAWIACYVETKSIDACSARVGHAIYPVPTDTRLQEKLDFLERYRLNLFSVVP